MYTFGLSGCCVNPGGPPGLHTTAENSKRAHLRVRALQTPPKFNEKTPRETQKERNGGGKGKKKREIFGPPPFGASTLRGPNLAPPFGPHPSGPHPSGPHPLGPFRAPPSRVCSSMFRFFILFVLLFLKKEAKTESPLSAKVGLEVGQSDCPKSAMTHHPAWVGHHTGGSRSKPTEHPCPVRTQVSRFNEPK